MIPPPTRPSLATSNQAGRGVHGRASGCWRGAGEGYLYDGILKKKEDKTDFLMHNKKKKFERLQASLKRQYISQIQTHSLPNKKLM
jgi:hypothetical protein